MPSEDISLGAMLISGLIAMALWGIACVQVYTYFIGSSSDRLLLKATIAFLCVLTTFDSALVCHFSYFYLITRFGSPLGLSGKLWCVVSLAHPTACAYVNLLPISTSHSQQTGAILLITQFGSKDIIFSPANASACRMFTHLVLINTYVAQLKAFPVVIRHFRFFGSDASIWADVDDLNIATVALANLSITISLCYLLHRSRTGLRRTNSVIRVLMMYTINTGGIVTLDSSLSMVEAVTKFRGPGDIPVSIAIILNGLYLNSYLAGLNAREGIRSQFQTNSLVSIRSQLFRMTFAPSSTSSPRPVV
ncbi:hypothetical protein BDN72DRAFT_957136 [Pluteus cervinus]|uniref:Uncharacterized protein n=1 Tax=Pluteus cervinus TaxID=181527 RepID=A0ACD3B6L2_9AGAR|nr:hypothetical protein BDN72DRAFT_957136 [Pluteus cervinus]